MREITDIKEIQKEILKVAITFRDIMDKHNIPYYMIGGTMLGAIRHGGFIPWDDDMDFGVPRAYYEIAIDTLSKELKRPYQIITSEQGLTLSDTAKIENLNTEIVEEARSEKLIKTGLFIDVFPLDVCNNKTGFFSRNRWISKLMYINQFKYNKPDSSKYRLIAKIVSLLPVNTMLDLSRKLLLKNGDYITNYSGLYGSKEIMPKSFIGKPTRYDFEDTFFCGIENFDAYLSHVYGDYMQLPPKEKQHSHISACYVKSISESDNKSK